MSFTTRPELRGTFGMVASTHWLASASGMAVLEQGGNAFDAAVAAGLTLRLRDVLRFAIGYADDGYPMLPQIAGAIRGVEQLFSDEWTTSAEVYLPVAEPGRLARNPALAATYRRVLDEAEARSSNR